MLWFRAGGYFTYLKGPLAAKIQTFRDLDKPVEEPVEAPVPEAPDPGSACAAHFSGDSEAWPAPLTLWKQQIVCIGFAVLKVQCCRFCPLTEPLLAGPHKVRRVSILEISIQVPVQDWRNRLRFLSPFHFMLFASNGTGLCVSVHACLTHKCLESCSTITSQG